MFITLFSLFHSFLITYLTFVTSWRLRERFAQNVPWLVFVYPLGLSQFVSEEKVQKVVQKIPLAFKIKMEEDTLSL